MPLSRRQFIRLLAGVGAGMSGVGIARRVAGATRAAGAAQAAAPAKTTSQWCMVIDLNRCDGCQSIGKPPGCQEACKKEHFVPPGQEWIAVPEKPLPGGGTYFMPSPCMHCENAPCEKVCPVGATYRTDEGLVLVNQDRCIGCRFCMAACPYDRRYFNWGDPPPLPPGTQVPAYAPEYPVPSRRGTVNKCMFCAHRLHMGRLPACVEGCPMGAMFMGDLTKDVASNGHESVTLSRLLADHDAYRYKEEKGTRPRVYYLPGHGQAFGRSST